MEQSYREQDLEISDTKIDCVECGNMFVLSLGEQRWFKDKGFSNPKRCPDCRTKRKEEREAEAGRKAREETHMTPQERRP